MAIHANIASGEALSGAIQLHGYRVSGIQMPSSWTTAALTFQGSVDGVTFNDIYDEAGVEFSVAAAASIYIGLDAGALELSDIPYLKVRSGTTGTPVNQGAAREIKLVA